MTRSIDIGRTIIIFNTNIIYSMCSFGEFSPPYHQGHTIGKFTVMLLKSFVLRGSFPRHTDLNI